MITLGSATSAKYLAELLGQRAFTPPKFWPHLTAHQL